MQDESVKALCYMMQMDTKANMPWVLEKADVGEEWKFQFDTWCRPFVPERPCPALAADFDIKHAIYTLISLNILSWSTAHSIFSLARYFLPTTALFAVIHMHTLNLIRKRIFLQCKRLRHEWALGSLTSFFNPSIMQSTYAFIASTPHCNLNP